MGRVPYKRSRSVMEYRVCGKVEKYVWRAGGLMLLSELRAEFHRRLESQTQSSVSTATTSKLSTEGLRGPAR